MYFTKVRWFIITAPLVAFAATILIVPAAHAQTATSTQISFGPTGVTSRTYVANVANVLMGEFLVDATRYNMPADIYSFALSLTTSSTSPDSVSKCYLLSPTGTPTQSVAPSATSTQGALHGFYFNSPLAIDYGNSYKFQLRCDIAGAAAGGSISWRANSAPLISNQQTGAPLPITLSNPSTSVIVNLQSSATSGTPMISVSSVQTVNSQLVPNTSVIGQLTTSGTTAIAATGYSMTLNADAQLTVGTVYKYPGGTSPVPSRAWCPKSGLYNFCKVTNITGGGPIDLSGGGSGNPTVRVLTVGYQWCKEAVCLTGSAKIATVNAYATSVLPKYASYNQLRQHFVTEVDCAYGTLSGHGVNVLVTPQAAISSVASSIQGINQCYVSYATSIVGKPGNTVTFESATLLLGFKPYASSTPSQGSTTPSQTLGASATELANNEARTSSAISAKTIQPLSSFASATDALMALAATSSGTSTPPTGTTTPPTATTTPSYGPNIVTNPGFESAKNNWSGWGTRTKLVTTEKHSGTYGMEFIHANSGTRSLNSGTTYAVVPGSKVLASAYVKTVGAGTTDAFLELEWRTSGGSILKRDQVAYTGGATAWTKVERTLTAPANAAKLKIHIKDMATPSVGSVFFDDISVQRAETVTAREWIFSRMLSSVFTIVEAVSAKR